uniref:Amino acid transporter transmembrane domain-containing protein n=3 Tax=Bombyx mori TaxID=7091 RepID=A0A8R2QZ79_BOMMO|nr:proton-coupled amino acid transporter-like protein pathetic isoform X1 [Bombyx mori]
MNDPARDKAIMEKNKSQSVKVDNFSSTIGLAANPGFQSTLSIASKGLPQDDKPYNPFEHRNVQHPNTTLGSILHLLKSCLGSGILAMPAAFKNSGLVAGVIGTILAGFVCTHTVHILVKTSQQICVEAKRPSLSFAETCGAAFMYGPKRLRSWSGAIQKFVDYSLSVTYLSVLCVYVVFIGSSLKEALDVYMPGYQLSIQAYCALSLVPLVVVCQIRNLKYLVPFSAIANALIFLVFAITLYYMFFDLPPVSDRVMVANVSTWPLFLSTVIFAMEGIGVVMPVENEMANPRRFLGCPGVLNTSMFIVITLYGVFGFFGYVQFGDDVKGSVTLNLPQDEIIAQSAKLIMAFVIYLTYALQFYVPMEIITRMLATRKSNSYENLIQITIRTCLVTLTVAIGAAFPNLELVIGLVGAIFFSTLGLFIPVAVQTIYLWEKDFGRFNYILWKNIIIAIIAIIALVSGAYVSIDGILEDFGRHTVINIVDENSTVT